ncbi:uncharacterized protein LOC110914670 [Helianthus annuus]|uniref:uncharacterized protein LOC110914670 n=1 Tax=Helianthus annuus TaxID=4232 RepID=UPI000B8FEAFC|nr:uncharacterized protein LOC110914670 [Helianthus annuus]
MRQRRWVELLNDHDCEICYHLGKANVVADALSRKNSCKGYSLSPTRNDLENCIHEAQYASVNEGSLSLEIRGGVEEDLVSKSDAPQTHPLHLSAFLLTLSLFYIKSDPFQSIFIWFSLSLLSGPFAPPSLTAGDIRVGLGPTLQPIVEETDGEEPGWEKIIAAVPGRSKAACMKRVADLKKDFRSSKAASQA